MKKSISVILCLSLVLCSLFSISSVAFAAEAPTAKSLLDVKTDGVFYDTITYTVYLKAGVNTAGAVVEAVYDPNVLEVVSAGQAQNSPISGYYTPGAKYDRNDMYNIGYIGFNDYKNGSKDTAFMQFTFKVKGTARPVTSVYFYCNQFSSDSQPQNEISGVGQEAFYTWTGTTLSTTHVTGATMFEGGVTVEWEPTIGATGYNVFKVVDGAWKIIGNTTDCYFVDTGVANNNVYQYTVRAYNDNGWQGNGWNSNFEQGVWVCYLLAPSFLWLSPSGNGVMASWTAAEGVDTYSLYRRTLNVDGTKGNWVYVGKTSNTSLVDSTSTVANWNNYEYAVCSVSGENESPKYTTSQVYTSANPYITLSLGSDGIWYCYINGTVNYDYSGILNYNGDWYYVKNGTVDWSFTGLTTYYGDYFYVQNGYLNFGLKTLTYYNGVWFYIENGTIKWDCDTLVNYNGDWYYAKDGVLASDYTGLVYYDGGWFYVVSGYLDWNQTTLAYYEGTWFYIENGIIKWDCDTLVQYCGDWYYVKNGMLASDYTGLVQYCGDWYYVVNGYLGFNQTTLVYYQGAWFYVVNSYLDWSQTTLVLYNGNWFYVENAVVKWDCDTLVNYCGDWYYVKGGLLASDYTGLVYFNGGWFYVVNGYLDWSQNTIAELNGAKFYIENGVIDWEYSGSFEYNGKTLQIENGVVVGEA